MGETLQPIQSEVRLLEELEWYILCECLHEVTDEEEIEDWLYY